MESLGLNPLEFARHRCVCTPIPRGIMGAEGELQGRSREKEEDSGELGVHIRGSFQKPHGEICHPTVPAPCVIQGKEARRGLFIGRSLAIPVYVALTGLVLSKRNSSVFVPASKWWLTTHVASF